MQTSPVVRVTHFQTEMQNKKDHAHGVVFYPVVQALVGQRNVPSQRAMGL